MSDFIFTLHAKLRMKERNISLSEVKRVVKNPMKLAIKDEGYMAIGLRNNGHAILVYYVSESDNIKVITVITTSKVSKYLS
jgi:uncharacterized DUF497 family protein